LGSRPESVQYSDFYVLHLLALLPPIGWLSRAAMGCALGVFTWSLRIALIMAAMLMWARANDHQAIKIEDNDFFYHDYCCRPAWLAGMHTALASAVVVSAASAYAVGWWKLEDDDGLPTRG
jgi:hypothetical protein